MTKNREALSPFNSPDLSSGLFRESWIDQSLDSIATERTSDLAFRAIVTDSRKVQKNDLFVAIKGEKMDGHHFITTAIANGAKGVLAEKSFIEKNCLETEHPHVRFFAVDDVQEAFRKLGGDWRKSFSIPVILIAGSNGKTTTKELLAAILRGKFTRVLKTMGSQNGYLGIPMTLLELRDHHEAAVIEVGIDEIGAMRKHVSLVEPTHSVLTVIGPEHLEKLIDVKTVAEEECLALEKTADLGGICVINLDDPYISPYSKRFTDAWCFTLDTKETPTSNNLISGTWMPSVEKNRIELSFQGNRLCLDVPLAGRHNAQNLLAAAAVATSLGMSPSQIERGLETFEGADGRSQIVELQSVPNVLVICDYYNASPVSMEAAFSLLAQTGKKESKKIACLGDMKELGKEELKFHASLAPSLLKSGAHSILLHGPRMRSLYQALREQGFSGELEHHDDLSVLTKRVLQSLQPQSVVLIKGSRSMKMETVWQELQKL